MLRFFLIFNFFIANFISLYSNTANDAINIIKVGIVDFEKISIDYVTPSLKNNLEKVKDKYQTKIDNLNRELELLKEEYEALEEGDNKVLRDKINKKIDEIKNVAKLGKNELDRLKNQSLSKLNSNNFLWSKIMSSIQKVAESKGFSIILKKDNPYLIYYNSITDITDDVINYLKTSK